MRNLIEYIKKAETWEGPSNEYEARIWDKEVELIHELIRRGESALLIKLMDCIKNLLNIISMQVMNMNIWKY